MKFTLSWLKEHLETNASLTEITDKLTALGLELEELTDPTEIYAPFKVAYVESATKHPDADRLNVCIVDTGSEKIQVVCGAPNARTGMKGIFAPNGAYIPGSDITLKKGKIRGQESNGMLVSMREMNLSDEHDGIIEVADDLEIGTSLTEVFDMNDPIIDIALTPNRGDCAGVRGIARDLAAAGMGTLKELTIPSITGNGASSVKVNIEAKEQCPLFMGRLVKNIENKSSPVWMQNRLKAVGLRPISALVDITNYVSLDLCRPLHVYDADLLKGDITVRLSKDGEEFEALNDKSYTAKEGMTAIADESGLIGLGGIVGGVSTGCTESTKNVFLECAYFDPMSIARAGRALGVESDARYRFERGVDPEFTVQAIDLATQLILDICGGDASDVVKAGDVPEWQREYEYDFDYTKKRTGVEIPQSEQVRILEDLGFTVNGKKISPPSWRSDILGKADLVEEIIRVYGFDKIPAVSIRSDNVVATGAETPRVSSIRLARAALAARGLNECVTYSFMSREMADYFGSNDNSLHITNPISSDMDQMRPSILGNLIMTAANNFDKGNGDSKLFEVGPTYQTSKHDGQSMVATGLRFGMVGERHWEGKDASRPNDIYDAKADALDVLGSIGLNTQSVQTAREASGYFHPGRSGVLKMGKNVLAQFGEIHPAVLDGMDVKGNVIGFEIFLDNVPAPKKKGSAKALLQLSTFQPVARDFAFIVDENVEVEAITRAAKGAERNLISDISVFDIYQGKGVDDGKKSVAINVVLQPVKQTLTDAEIDGLSKKIIEAVAAKTGGVLRG